MNTKRLSLRWFNHLGNLASVSSFAGAGVSWWLKQPLLLGLALGLGVGIFLGRWIARFDEAAGAPLEPHLGPPTDPRTSLIEDARAIAVRLTTESWTEFPAWKWSIPGSKHALQVVIERVGERVVPSMTPLELESLTHESVRMYIAETLDHRAAVAQANATSLLRRQNSWVMRWRR